MLPLKRFTDFIKQNALFDEQTTVLVAVSGGMDSVLLTHLLRSSNFRFAIAHCNFQLRGDESTRDQHFCSNLADQLGVPFYVNCFDTKAYASGNKISTQMAARQLRYQWFYEVSQEYGYGAIALAHHQNDSIETILLNLTRGTGIAGMHGILPKNGLLVRPMLFLDRAEIASLVAVNGVDYVEDSSNQSVKYARNKIRKEVIPVLKELNPALEKTFDKNLSRFRETEKLLDAELGRLKKSLFLPVDGKIHLAIAEIVKLYPQRLLLFGLLQEYGFNASTVDDVIASLDKHPGRLFESATHTLVLDRVKLILAKKQKHPETVTIKYPDTQTANYGNYIVSILHNDSPLIIKDNPMAVSVDADKLIYPLTIRAWQQSDSFHPLGMRTKQRLSDYFIHQKISLLRKKEVPLLINGNKDIIWVGGYRPDERYKVSDQTKKVTIFELIKR